MSKMTPGSLLGVGGAERTGTVEDEKMEGKTDIRGYQEISIIISALALTNDSIAIDPKTAEKIAQTLVNRIGIDLIDSSNPKKISQTLQKISNFIFTEYEFKGAAEIEILIGIGFKLIDKLGDPLSLGIIDSIRKNWSKTTQFMIRHQLGKFIKTIEKLYADNDDQNALDKLIQAVSLITYAQRQHLIIDESLIQSLDVYIKSAIPEVSPTSETLPAHLFPKNKVDRLILDFLKLLDIDPNSNILGSNTWVTIRHKILNFASIEARFNTPEEIEALSLISVLISTKEMSDHNEKPVSQLRESLLQGEFSRTYNKIQKYASEGNMKYTSDELVKLRGLIEYGTKFGILFPTKKIIPLLKTLDARKSSDPALEEYANQFRDILTERVGTDFLGELQPDTREALTQLRTLTKPRMYSKDQLQELEKDINSLSDGFNGLAKQLVKSDVAFLTLSTQLEDLIASADTNSVLKSIAVDYEKLPTGAKAKKGLDSDLNEMEQIELKSKLRKLLNHLTTLSSNEQILNPPKELFMATGKVGEVLGAIGYVYFESLKKELVKSPEFTNIRRSIFKSIAFKVVDGQVHQRDQIAFALVGDIGSGKSNISAMGIAQHGSGTDHLSGSKNSVYHKAYQGIMESWIPMRDLGYPMYPLMELLFEIGLLGFRESFDNDTKYGEDFGLMLDGYPRSVEQLDLILKFADEMGITDIGEYYKLIYTQFEAADLVSPGDDVKKLIIKRLILSRTFDGLGIPGARKDHFGEIMIEGVEQNYLPELITTIINTALQHTAQDPAMSSWGHKIMVIDAAYNMFTEKIENDLANVSINPKGRLVGYRMGMDKMKNELTAKDSSIKPHTIEVTANMSRLEMQDEFAAATFGEDIWDNLRVQAAA